MLRLRTRGSLVSRRPKLAARIFSCCEAQTRRDTVWDGLRRASHGGTGRQAAPRTASGVAGGALRWVGAASFLPLNEHVFGFSIRLTACRSRRWVT